MAGRILRAQTVDDIVAKGNEISGHAVVYDQTTNIGDCFYERIERGALDGCDLTDVLFLTNHDMNRLALARSRRNTPNSTLQLAVDDSGLGFTALLDIENNVEARALYSAVSRGDVAGMSFLMWIKDEEWQDVDSAMPTRIIKRVDKIQEISAVNLPAYEGTDIYARSAATLDNEKRALENARAASRLDSIERARRQALAKINYRWRSI